MGVAGRGKGIPESLFDDLGESSPVHQALMIAEVRSVMDFGRQQLRRVPGVRQGTGEPVKRLNIYERSPEEVRAFLASLPVREEWVQAVWPSENAGVRMRYVDFVRYYNSLWYPSRDDVWLTSEDRGWFIELDHEEILTFVPRNVEEYP
jgi:hypothetical protein